MLAAAATAATCNGADQIAEATTAVPVTPS